MRRALVATGSLLMTYGVAGAILDDDVDLIGVIVFGLVLLVLNDAVFLPLVSGAGLLLRRIVPAGWQATVRVAAIVDLAVVVVALPLVLGYGRVADNATVLPRSYGNGLLLVLAVATVSVLACRKGIERTADGRRGRPPG